MYAKGTCTLTNSNECMPNVRAHYQKSNECMPKVREHYQTLKMYENIIKP